MEVATMSRRFLAGPSKALLAALSATLAVGAVGVTEASACGGGWERGGCESYYAPPVAYQYGPPQVVYVAPPAPVYNYAPPPAAYYPPPGAGYSSASYGYYGGGYGYGYGYRGRRCNPGYGYGPPVAYD